VWVAEEISGVRYGCRRAGRCRSRSWRCGPVDVAVVVADEVAVVRSV
jgi:hypothetical protein